MQLATFLEHQLAVRACLVTQCLVLLDNPDFKLAALVADDAVQTACCKTNQV